ncbi:MAG: septal ring lytic transglycosylase RlpA family protein [Thermosynechococcaceae cyanobacterium]
MNNKPLISGLASALVVSVLCALSVGQASERTSDASQVDAPQQAIDQPVPSDNAAQPQAASEEKIGESQAEEPAAPSLTRLYSHQMSGKEAVTLYVRSIPVVTFLGETAKANAGQTKVAEPSDQKAEQEEGPMWRATTVAAKINQLQSSAGDTVRVSWDKQQKTYVIRIGKDQLVAMDKNTLLPNTTKDEAEDALQITNRIRRQLGNAAPLTTIPGRPQPTVIAKPQPADQVATRSVVSTQRGQASWYGGGFHGRKTASGERYNQNEMTAAHKRLRFGTRVRVTNLSNGRSVVVRINDRGPFVRGRVIDLSRSGAQAIGMMGSGVAPVSVEVLR